MIYALNSNVETTYAEIVNAEQNLKGGRDGGMTEGEHKSYVEKTQEGT